MWLSLVERCVRDAEVVGSNPAIPTIHACGAGRFAGLSAYSGEGMLDAFFQAIGYGLCHQIPVRSFAAGGYQLPVCARDTGIYAGLALGILALWLISRGRRPTELPRWPVLVLVGAFILVMVYDGVTSYAGLRATTNEMRLLSGLLAGWGLATLIVPMVNSQLWARSDSSRVLEGPRQVAAWLGLLAAAYALLRWALPLAGVVYPLLLSASIIFSFVMVNVVIVTLVPRFERQCERARDAWAIALLALALSAAEIGLAALLRTLVERVA